MVFTAGMEKLSPTPKAAPRAPARSSGRDQHHGQPREAAVDVADVLPGDAEGPHVGSPRSALVSEGAAGEVQEHHLQVGLGQADLGDAGAGGPGGVEELGHERVGVVGQQRQRPVLRLR